MYLTRAYSWFDTYGEFEKCRNSIKYFAETYIKLPDRLHGQKDFKLNEFQKRALSLYESRDNFCLYGDRSSGKTTMALIILLHSAIFGDSGHNFFIPCTHYSAYVYSAVLFDMYENLPDFVKNRVILYRKRNLFFFVHSYSPKRSFIEITQINHHTFVSKKTNNLYFDEVEVFGHYITDFQVDQIMEYNPSVFSFSSSNAKQLFGDKIYV